MSSIDHHKRVFTLQGRGCKEVLLISLWVIVNNKWWRSSFYEIKKVRLNNIALCEIKKYWQKLIFVFLEQFLFQTWSKKIFDFRIPRFNQRFHRRCKYINRSLPPAILSNRPLTLRTSMCGVWQVKIWCRPQTRDDWPAYILAGPFDVTIFKSHSGRAKEYSDSEMFLAPLSKSCLDYFFSRDIQSCWCSCSVFFWLPVQTTVDPHLFELSRDRGKKFE